MLDFFKKVFLLSAQGIFQSKICEFFSALEHFSSHGSNFFSFNFPFSVSGWEVPR